MTIDKQELRRLAEAATEGPWESVKRTGYEGDHYDLIQTQQERNGWEIAEVRMDVPHENSAFIAAASPSTILALLDELAEDEGAMKVWRRRAEQAEAELESCKRDADRYKKLKELAVREGWYDEEGVDAVRLEVSGIGDSLDDVVDGVYGDVS